MQYKKLFLEEILLNSGYVSHLYEAGKMMTIIFQRQTGCLKNMRMQNSWLLQEFIVCFRVQEWKLRLSMCRTKMKMKFQSIGWEKLIDLLNVINLNKDKLENKNGIDCLNSPVKKDYLPYKEALVKRCSEFAG